MSEQASTLQIEETVPVQQQPESEPMAPEVSDASNKVVEPEKKPQEEVNKVAGAVSEEVVHEKPTSEVSTEKEVVESSEAEKKDQVDESNKVVEDKSEEAEADDKPAGEQPAKEEVVSEATNGDGHNDKKAEEPVAEETNGVCKRKAENGAEVVEDEKSPKKAKVVDDGDQAPVEETAA